MYIGPCVQPSQTLGRCCFLFCQYAVFSIANACGKRVHHPRAWVTNHNKKNITHLKTGKSETRQEGGNWERKEKKKRNNNENDCLFLFVCFLCFSFADVVCLFICCCKVWYTGLGKGEGTATFVLYKVASTPPPSPSLPHHHHLSFAVCFISLFYIKYGRTTRPKVLHEYETIFTASRVLCTGYTQYPSDSISAICV